MRAYMISNAKSFERTSGERQIIQHLPSHDAINYVVMSHSAIFVLMGETILGSLTAPQTYVQFLCQKRNKWWP